MKKGKKRYVFQGERHGYGKPFYTPIFAKIALFLPETQKKNTLFFQFPDIFEKTVFLRDTRRSGVGGARGVSKVYM